MLFKAGQTHARGDGADGPQARPPPATTALAPSKSPSPPWTSNRSKDGLFEPGKELAVALAAPPALDPPCSLGLVHGKRRGRWRGEICTFSRWQARPSSCTRGWLVGPGSGSVRLRVLLCVEQAGTRCGYRPCQRRWWTRRCTGRTPPSAVTSEWQVSGSRHWPSRGLTLPPISPPTRPQTCRPSRAAGIHALRSLVHSCRYWQTVPVSCSCAPSDLFLPKLKSSTCCGQLCRHICSPTLA